MVLPPALMVMEPPARMPRLASEVSTDNEAVPVAVAGVAAESDDDEDGDVVVGALELPDKMFWMSDVSSVFTRFNAVELAMLARPLPKLVSAELIAEMTELVADSELSSLCCWFQ